MWARGKTIPLLTQTAGSPTARLFGALGASAPDSTGTVRAGLFHHAAPPRAADWNHALYAQDSWTIGQGLTLSLGLRIEKETLPAPGGIKVSSIDFPWSDKIEPRLGAAWDPTRKGTMKIFGSYGVANDVMKLLLAQTSWGAQAYEQCSYALGPDGNGGFST